MLINGNLCTVGLTDPYNRIRDTDFDGDAEMETWVNDASNLVFM